MPREYPYLLIFKEKHGERYYLVQNESEPRKIYLHVLTERFKSGWYDWMKHEPGPMKIRYNMIKKAVEEQLVDKAGTLIRSQADGEYEGYEEETFDSFS